MEFHGPFAVYRLEPWPGAESDDAKTERLRFFDEAEVQRVLRRLLAEGSFDLRLQALVGDSLMIGTILDERGVLEYLARLIVRGQLVLTRRPIEIISSETFEEVLPIDYEAPDNEINEGLGLVASVEIIQPRFDPEVTIEPPPIPELECMVIPPPVPELLAVPIQPVQPIYESTPERPPSPVIDVVLAPYPTIDGRSLGPPPTIEVVPESPVEQHHVEIEPPFVPELEIVPEPPPVPKLGQQSAPPPIPKLGVVHELPPVPRFETTVERPKDDAPEDEVEPKSETG